MEKVTIFLASSSELIHDREQLEIMINRKNKEWVSKDVFFELVIWEDFLDSISKTRLQDEYNKAIKECDIFIMLFFTKVGTYTDEEFDTAYKQFKATGKPFIYTYFKDAAVSTAELDEKVISLIQFKKKLRDLGHFYTLYKNIDDLKYQFSRQLDKLLIEKNFILANTQKSSYEKMTSPANIQQNHSGSGDNIGRDKIIGGKA